MKKLILLLLFSLNLYPYIKGNTIVIEGANVFAQYGGESSGGGWGDGDEGGGSWGGGDPTVGSNGDEWYNEYGWYQYSNGDIDYANGDYYSNDEGIMYYANGDYITNDGEYFTYDPVNDVHFDEAGNIYFSNGDCYNWGYGL